MPNDNTSPEISLKDFSLPFLSVPKEEVLDEDEELEDLDKDEQLQKMEALLPADAISLGCLSGEVAHSPGLTWELEDYYYLLPWKEDGYDWAMVRITWDDNWGQFDWTTDARIKGVKDPKQAALQLFQGLIEHWNIDLEDADNESYVEFLESLRQKAGSR